jgi:hypothetical protein
MRYVILALLSLSLASPLLVGCESDSSHTKTTSHNPITGTTTTKEQSSSQTHTDNNP